MAFVSRWLSNGTTRVSGESFLLYQQYSPERWQGRISKVSSDALTRSLNQYIEEEQLKKSEGCNIW